MRVSCAGIGHVRELGAKRFDHCLCHRGSSLHRRCARGAENATERGIVRPRTRVFPCCSPARRGVTMARLHGRSTMNIYEQGLDKTAANFVALSPTSFVERSAEVFGDLEAVVHGAAPLHLARDARSRGAAGGGAARVRRRPRHDRQRDAPQHARDGRGALRGAGAERRPQHAQHPARRGADRLAAEPLRVRGADHRPRARADGRRGAAHPAPRRTADGRSSSTSATANTRAPGERLGAHEYEALLAAHAPLRARSAGPADEWDAIAVSYTSGTTGDPKGVVTHHRGAYLNAVCNAATWTMPHFPRYLWTLPMFHCNGWCFPWTVALLGGTHVCLRKVEAAAILAAIRDERVDHYCARADRPQPADRRARGDAPRHHAEGEGDGRGRRAAGVDDRGHGADRLRDHPRLRAHRGLRAGGGRGQAAVVAATRRSPSRRA